MNQIIPLRKAGDSKRLTRKKSGRKPVGTTPSEQAARLGPKLERAFSSVLDRSDIEISLSPDAFAPERVLVFETIGDIASFAKAANRVGLEWLAEQATVLEGLDYLAEASDEDDEDEDSELLEEGDESVDFVMADEVPQVTRLGRFYIGMPTLETFEQLRRLWGLYSTGGPRPDGHSDWWDLFNRLHDLRPWSVADRIPEATRNYAERILNEDPDAHVIVEVDLWYRMQETARHRAMTAVSQAVTSSGGEILDTADIEEIRYCAILARVPASTAEDIITAAGDLATSRDVMRICPQTLADIAPAEPGDEGETDEAIELGASTKPALAALLDGYPVQNHALLRGLLDVVEVDVDESMAPLPTRFHGTAMASLIMLGDLQEPGPVPQRTLKVVPILAPRDDGNECHPAEALIVKTIFDAVAALKSPQQGEPAGPDVIIVNQSVCDKAAPFAAAAGPWARALDYLAYEHKLLFIVSAGNITDPFRVPGYDDVLAFTGADVDERRRDIMFSLDDAKAKRGTLAPAEAVNALTVGSSHGDASTLPIPGTVVDPYGQMTLPSLASALGFGVDGALKPEVLTDGGRIAALPAGSPLSVRAHETPICFGQAVAAPDPFTAKLTKTRRCSGTSNAAALSTRSALFIADALDETFADEDTAWQSRPSAACMLKALVAHSSAWREHGDEFDAVLAPQGARGRLRRRAATARHLGYGRFDTSRIIDAAGNRVTLLADDQITIGRRHTYQIPIPQEFGGIELRRITLTLAWLSPIKPQSAHYRAIALDVVGADGSTKIWNGVRRIAQPPVGISRKGTLLHAVYEGSGRATALSNDASFEVNVQAFSRAPTKLTKAPVPYALAITLELADSIETDIVTRIVQRLREPVRA